jgi:glucose-6-phosphate isomerase
MRFDDDFIDSMTPAMNSAFKDMAELESGAIANPDENRMVGHYWLRNPQLAPTAELAEEIQSSISKIAGFAKAIHSGEIKTEKGGTFNKVLLVGIGGSALGPQLVADALWHQDNPMELFYIDNTDPDGIAKTLTQIGEDLKDTLTIVVSKSGGTVETRNGNLEAAKAYQKLGLSFEKHAVAVTCPESKLDNLAKDNGWLERIHMWDWVGGRVSIFAAVGLLPAALQGVDIEQFIAGAKEMDDLTRVDSIDQNPAARLALMWYAAGDGKGKKDMVVLPYKDRICLFSKYLQQLVMESLGKERDLDGNVVHQGIAVYGNKGSTDQHAYVQQLRDGLNNFFVTFVEVLQDYTDGSDNVSNLQVETGITSGDYLNGFFQGTRRALFESNRDSITITIDELSPKSLGALIAMYDRTVGFYASLVNINAYHQPGVEAGKKAAAQVIDLQKAIQAQLESDSSNDGLTADELSKAIGQEDEAESVYKILEHFAANPQRGVVRTGDRHPTTSRYKLSA